jgi:hypothetical protein
MTEIEKVELESVDDDIKEAFKPLCNGGYRLGFPSEIQIARNLTKTCKMSKLFMGKCDTTYNRCGNGSNS